LALLLVIPARAVMLGKFLIRRIGVGVVPTVFGEAGFNVAGTKMELDPPK
jgi:hypothetical protein